MPETTDGAGSQTTVADAGVGPTATPSVSSPPENKGRISALLEWSKPYRELMAILTTVIISVSAGVAWIVAHVATQAELHYLECRVTNNILTQLLPIHMEEFAGKIDWRAVQIKVLAQHGGGTPQSIGTIVDLTDQVNALTQAQNAAAMKFQTDIDDITKNCISETPKIGKTP